MTPNNNLSVLPFYTSIEQQNARKWWVYGRIYPLFTPIGYLPPFQIIMPTESGATTDTFDFSTPNKWNPAVTIPTPQNPLNIGAATYEMNNVVLDFTDFPASSCILKSGLPHFSIYAQGDTGFNVRTADNAKIRSIEFVGWQTERGTFTPDVPGEMDNTNGVFIPSQPIDDVVFMVDDEISFNSIVITYADRTILRDSKGNAVMDITDELDGVGEYKIVGDWGIFIYPYVQLSGLAQLPIGQYYLDMIYDGYQFYSDVFTAVNDISGYVKLEWWDDSDFVMDAGAIVYAEPEYKNVLYLETDIAKPDYDFSEDVIERDGYTFPVKRVSAKRYRFSFLASEYLLDVMRLIRMADHIRITDYHGRVYDKIDAFLITPEWENNGDVAVVNAEFTTDTVAKKNGLVTTI